MQQPTHIPLKSLLSKIPLHISTTMKDLTKKPLETRTNEERNREIIAALQQLFQLIDEPCSSGPTEKRRDNLVDEDKEKVNTDAIDRQYQEDLRGEMLKPEVACMITRTLLQIMSPEAEEEKKTALLQGFWDKTSNITLSNGKCISSEGEFVALCKSLQSQKNASEKDWDPLIEHFRKFRGSEVLEVIDTYGRCIDAPMEIVLKKNSQFIKIVNKKIDSYCNQLKLSSTTLAHPAGVGVVSDFTPKEQVIFGSYYSLPFDIFNIYFQGKLEYKAPAL